MGKNWDATIDAGLNALKAGAIRVAMCSAEPANYAGIAAVTLGTATISSSDFTGPDDHTSGRKLTFNGKAGVTPSGNGTVTHLAFHNNSSILYAVTTTTSQAVTDQQTWDIPGSVVLSVADPT